MNRIDDSPNSRAIRPLSAGLTARSFGGVSKVLQRLALLALLVLLAAGCPSTDVRPPASQIVNADASKTWVFTAGVSNYRDGSLSLRYAHSDAVAVAEFFKSASGGHVPLDQVMTFVNEQATRVNILSALQEIAHRSDRDDLIIIFLSMHGMGEPVYFLAHDTQPNKLLPTGISEDDIVKAISGDRRSAKRVILFLDTCHAGSFGFSGLDGKRAIRAEGTKRLVSRLADQGMGVLAASEEGEYSEEDARWGGGHGVFTYHLLNGLKGDADADHDGVITLRELFKYTAPRVSKDRNDEQNPIMMGKGNLLVVRAPSAPPLFEASATPSAQASCSPRLDVLVDDMDDGDNQILLNEGRSGYWYTFLDRAGSTMLPEAGGTFIMSTGGAHGSRYAARMRGKISSAAIVYAGMGFNFIDPKGGYDASRYNALSFWAKIDSKTDLMRVRLKVPDRNTDQDGRVCSECFNDFGIDLDLTTTWTHFMIPFATMTQMAGWGEPHPAALDPHQLYGIQWQVNEPGRNYDLWVGDIRLVQCK